MDQKFRNFIPSCYAYKKIYCTWWHMCYLTRLYQPQKILNIRTSLKHPPFNEELFPYITKSPDHTVFQNSHAESDAVQLGRLVSTSG
jgi:hypothetical protein